jgi:predicted nucleic acid-binding protein
VTTVVLDASVAVKWVLPPSNEDLVPEAVDLLRRYVREEIRFVVPDIFWAEFGNVAWKAVRLGRWTAEEAQTALGDVVGRNFPTVPSEDLLKAAFTLASAFNRSLYDGLYVALAIANKCEMITADEKLANALAARLPVRWLGAL